MKKKEDLFISSTLHSHKLNFQQYIDIEVYNKNCGKIINTEILLLPRYIYDAGDRS